ncbi:hypothetical protein [Martelella alba]|nr:hypothetical protein [Martelella alba]
MIRPLAAEILAAALYKMVMLEVKFRTILKWLAAGQQQNRIPLR